MLDFVQKITKRRIRRINRFTPCTPFENGGGVARKSSAAAAFGGGVQHCLLYSGSENDSKTWKSINNELPLPHKCSSGTFLAHNGTSSRDGQTIG